MRATTLPLDIIVTETKAVYCLMFSYQIRQLSSWHYSEIQQNTYVISVQVYTTLYYLYYWLYEGCS